jgi:hypothetical protein
MHRVDPSGLRLATEVEYRHHGYVAKIDTVSSGGRRCSYDIFAPDSTNVGSARSLREAAEVIDQHRREIRASASDQNASGTRPLPRVSNELVALFRDHPCNPGWDIHPEGGRDHDDPESRTLWHEGKSYGSNDLATMQCEKGHKWRTYLENIFKGLGCPVCATEGKRRIGRA